MRAIRQLHKLGKIRKELKEIYLNQVIQTFALSLIGIFIPIYLLNLGFNMNSVLIFMVVQWSILAFIAPVSAKLSSSIGLKHTILLRMPVLMLYIFLLMFIGNLSMGFLFIIAILGGMSLCLYWVPLNAEFVKNTDQLHIGQEIGFMMALPRIAGIFAPFIGGAILELFGFNPLFILVLVLIIISVIPLFMSADYRSAFRFSIKDTKISIKRNFSGVYFIYGMLHMGETLVWPVFIFVMLSDILVVGAAASITAIGISFFTVLIGKVSDRIYKRKLLIMGAIGYSLVWFSRVFSASLIDVLLLSFMGGLFDSLVHISLFSQFCDEARKENILAHVSSREFWLGIGRIAPLMLVIFFSVQSLFTVMFVSTGLLCLGLMVFKSEYDIRQSIMFSPTRKRKIRTGMNN